MTLYIDNQKIEREVIANINEPEITDRIALYSLREVVAVNNNQTVLLKEAEINIKDKSDIAYDSNTLIKNLKMEILWQKRIKDFDYITIRKEGYNNRNIAINRKTNLKKEEKEFIEKHKSLVNEREIIVKATDFKLIAQIIGKYFNYNK